jgi:translation initiation factor 2 alpha subunit (eIF-2alpha)
VTNIIKKYNIGGQYVAKIIRADIARRYFDLSFKALNDPPTLVMNITLSNNPVSVSLQ